MHLNEGLGLPCRQNSTTLEFDTQGQSILYVFCYSNILLPFLFRIDMEFRIRFSKIEFQAEKSSFKSLSILRRNHD